VDMLTDLPDLLSADFFFNGCGIICYSGKFGPRSLVSLFVCLLVRCWLVRYVGSSAYSTYT
jgi:hypothetical protein